MSDGATAVTVLRVFHQKTYMTFFFIKAVEFCMFFLQVRSPDEPTVTSVLLVVASIMFEATGYIATTRKDCKGFSFVHFYVELYFTFLIIFKFIICNNTLASLSHSKQVRSQVLINTMHPMKGRLPQPKLDIQLPLLESIGT